MATTKRIIGLPKTTATTNPNQSTIAWGTSSLLPTDNATAKVTAPTPVVPAPVSTPTQVKTFSDNMTKPILDQETMPKEVNSIPMQTTAPLNVENIWPQPITQGEAIGQNADWTLIYGSNTPTAPAPTGIQYDAQWKVIDNKSNRDLQTVEELKTAAQKGMWTPWLTKIQEWWLSALALDLSNYESEKQKLEASQANYQKQSELKLQKAAIEYNNEIEQVRQQAEAQIWQATMWWALSWAGQSSLFWQWIDRLKTNMNTTLMRLQELYQITQQSESANLDEAMTNYQNALKDARMQFEYNHRDVMQTASYDLNKIMWMAGDLGVWYDRSKIEKSLDILSSNVYSARQKAYASYIDNVSAQQDILNKQVDWLLWMQQYQQLQTKWLTTQLDMNDWAATLQLNQNQLNDYVNKWALTQAQALGYKMQAEQKAYNELIKYSNTTNYDWKVITPWRIDMQDMEQVRALVQGGFTYAQAVQKVVTENPNKYNPTPIITPMEQAQMLNAEYDRAYKVKQMNAIDMDIQTQWLKNQAVADWILQKQAAQQGIQISQTIDSPQTQQAVASTSQSRRGTDKLQCGELVNDYLRQVTGKWKWASLGKMNLGNTYQDKINAIGNIGKSNTPQVWWIFAMKLGDTGHTGIVTSWVYQVQKNWKAIDVIDVLDANRDNNTDDGWKPTQRKAVPIAWMTFSVAPAQKVEDKDKLKSIVSMEWWTEFTTNQRYNAIDQAQTNEDMFDIVKQLAKQQLWATNKTDLVDAETSLDWMRYLAKAFAENKGKQPTNVVNGLMEKAYNAFWIKWEWDLKTLDVKASMALQAYRNAISGTAYSEQEWADIANIFPSIKKSADLNKAIIEASSSYMQNKIDSLYWNVPWLWELYNKYKSSWEQTISNNNPSWTKQVSSDDQALATLSRKK
jgi:hypothetical protein